MSRRAALTLALLAALPACGSSDTPTNVVQHVGSHELPHPDHRAEATDPTAHLAEALAAADAAATRTSRRRAARDSRTRSTITARTGAVERGGSPLTSTAYCETGLMANGQHTFDGAVAMNGQPLGSRWLVVETGRVYVVADRIGHGSEFDIAMPGDCAGARRYGRRSIHVERVA